MSPFQRSLRAIAVVAALTVVAAACGDDDEAADDDVGQVDDTTEDTAEDDSDDASEDDGEDAAGFEGTLAGLFSINDGQCEGTAISGSYFRMVQPGGTLEDGPFVPNGDSPCSDQTWSPVTAGDDGGLDTTTLQVAPDPAFDETGNGLAADIIQPVLFFGVAFAVAMDGDLPALVATDGTIEGELSAWTAYYGNENFNQGAPKPDGTMPGLTSAPTGTIDPETGEYVLEWRSQIVGGAFNDFTGVWHLEGTFSE